MRVTSVITVGDEIVVKRKNKGVIDTQTLGKTENPCEGGSSGENVLDYAKKLGSLFTWTTFPSGHDLVVSFGGYYGDASFQSEALNSAFNGANNLKSIKIKCGLTGNVAMNRAFTGAWGEAVLEKIDLSEMVQPILASDMQVCFSNRTKLVEILGEFDASAVTSFNGAFQLCESLQTVRFTNGSIKKPLSFKESPSLTDETVQNIIDGLADLTGATAQTLTLHATVGAKLTDAQKASASANNWTISY